MAKPPKKNPGNRTSNRGGVRFQPGNKFGKGRPKLPDDLKQFKKITKTEIEAIFSKLSRMSKRALSEYSQDDETGAIEAMVAMVMVKSIEDGCHSRLDFVLNRTIGKVDTTVRVELPAPTIVEDFESDKKLVLGRVGQEIVDGEVVSDDD